MGGSAAIQESHPPWRCGHLGLGDQERPCYEFSQYRDGRAALLNKALETRALLTIYATRSAIAAMISFSHLTSMLLLLQNA